MSTFHDAAAPSQPGGRPRVVILGGGSGGLELAAQLGGRDDVEIVLVDREPTHLWKPRLHEFAAGTISSSLAELSFYLLASLRGFRFEQGSVTGLDLAGRRVRLDAIRDRDGRVVAPPREIAYDWCVVALGGVVPDAGTTGVAEHAIRLDTKDDADRFRARFAAAMIAARETRRPAEVVIVGSGATGTELAAHLRRSERAFFDGGESGRQPRLLGITLLEGAPEIMPGVDADLRAKLLDRLAALEIDTHTSVEVAQVSVGEVSDARGKSWPADLVVWAAGLVGAPSLADLGLGADEKGRIPVDPTLRSQADERVFVFGDAASLKAAGSERPLPPTAQAASQQASYLAETLPIVAKGDPVEPFRYDDKGRIVSLAAAGTVGRIGLGGRDDLLIHGQFATAAYHALQRQHQWRVLGLLRGSVAIAADMISPAKGPALKLHGG